MNGWKTVEESFSLKIYFPGSVAVHSIVVMVDFADLFLYVCLTGIIIRLPVFPVVVIGIWTDVQMAKDPAKPKLCMVLLNKSISL